MDDSWKLSKKWIRRVKKYFYEFLDDTGFPDPERDGERGPGFDYPERLIMLIAILAVKCKVKTYIGIHRLVVHYWDDINDRSRAKPISERQLRDRLKKIGHSPGEPPGFISQIFPRGFLD